MPKQVAKIFAIESSCDDSSVAVVDFGGLRPRVLGLATQSQNDVHEKFGGVVPELASRAHLKNLIPCASKAMSEAAVSWDDIDLIAATHRPGLVGSLLIGHTMGKTLSYLFEKPLISVHHIHAHIQSVFLEFSPRLPFLAAVVSGGHTSLFVVRDGDVFEEVGSTRDDALGEAFDKGAKLLGLGFPGGAELEAFARGASDGECVFGPVKVENLDFSFSGLKSELQRRSQREEYRSKPRLLAASYQSALLNHLMDKVQIALEKFSIRSVAIVGGVARNMVLRSRLDAIKENGKIDEWFAPSPDLCTDNAAMVAVSAFYKWQRAEVSPLQEDVFATSRNPRGRKS